MTELFPPSVTQRQGKMTLFQALPHAPGAHGGENPPILIQRGFGQSLEGAPGSELPWTCSLRLPSTPGEAAQTASSNSAILTAHPNPAPQKLQGHYPWVWWFQLAFVGTCPDFTGRAEGREGALGSDKHLFANKTSWEGWLSLTASLVLSLPPQVLRSTAKVSGEQRGESLGHPTATVAQLIFCLGLPWVQFRSGQRAEVGRHACADPGVGRKGNSSLRGATSQAEISRGSHQGQGPLPVPSHHCHLQFRG